MFVDNGDLLGYVVVGPAWICATVFLLKRRAVVSVNLIEYRSRSAPSETRWMNAYQQTM